MNIDSRRWWNKMNLFRNFSEEFENDVQNVRKNFSILKFESSMDPMNFDDWSTIHLDSTEKCSKIYLNQQEK